MDASIIIVTRDRAMDLTLTLDALRVVQVPDGMKVELLIVDNGSRDETAEVIATAKPGTVPIRYLYEERPGKTVGQNTGLAETTGKVILLTDDDVRPPVEWLTKMCEPIVNGDADGVSGGVRIAQSLLRPWMKSMHRSWLASTEWLMTDGAPQSMVGANMAFTREVLRRVPGFDHELGPGAAGFADDHLFAVQLLEAGYRLIDRTDICVEHYFDPYRLMREAWLVTAEKHGMSSAYVGHHWEHWGCRLGGFRLLKAKHKLANWRAANQDKIVSEGCCEEELDLIYHWATIREHLKIRNDKRKYQYHGLVKLENPRSLALT